METHVVTIINPDGSKTEMVIKDGKDGKSPKVSVGDNGNGVIQSQSSILTELCKNSC